MEKDELKRIEMNSKFLLLSFLFFTLIFGTDSCTREGSGNYCGSDCTGTPMCTNGKCGNVDDMCFCDCNVHKCKTTDLGIKWNDGIKLANGSYALNGTAGDGKDYRC